MSARLVFALAVALLGACRDKVTRGECARMLERYVELSAAQDPTLVGLPPSQADEVRAERVAEKRASKEFARAEEDCMRDVSRKELECAMAAKTPNDWEACVE